MIEIIMILIIISMVSNIITEHLDPLIYIKDKMGLGRIRKLKSDYGFIDMILFTIWKLLNCSLCISYWLTVIYFLPSYEGFYLGFITYGITMFLYNKLFTTSL